MNGTTTQSDTRVTISMPLELARRLAVCVRGVLSVMDHPACSGEALELRRVLEREGWVDSLRTYELELAALDVVSPAVAGAGDELVARVAIGPRFVTPPALPRPRCPSPADVCRELHGYREWAEHRERCRAGCAEHATDLCAEGQQLWTAHHAAILECRKVGRVHFLGQRRIDP